MTGGGKTTAVSGGAVALVSPAVVTVESSRDRAESRGTAAESPTEAADVSTADVDVSDVCCAAPSRGAGAHEERVIAAVSASRTAETRCEPVLRAKETEGLAGVTGSTPIGIGPILT